MHHTVDQVVPSVVAQMEPLLASGPTQFLQILWFDISGVSSTLDLVPKMSARVTIWWEWRLMKHCYTLLLNKNTKYYRTTGKGIVISQNKKWSANFWWWCKFSIRMFKYTILMTLWSKTTEWDHWCFGTRTARPTLPCGWHIQAGLFHKHSWPLFSV